MRHHKEPEAFSSMRSAASRAPSFRDFAEMARLHALSETGDRAARDTFLRAHLPIALKVARRYANRSWGVKLGVEDVAQTAFLGLVHAARHYDPEWAAKFPGYAMSWMISKAQALAAGSAHKVSVPRHLLTKATSDMKKGTADETASKAVLDVIRGENAVSQLDQEWSIARYPDARAASSYEEVEREDERELARRLLGRLDPVYGDILRRRFGIDPYNEPQTTYEVGAAYGETRRWADVKLANAMKAMKRLGQRARHPA